MKLTSCPCPPPSPLLLLLPLVIRPLEVESPNIVGLLTPPPLGKVAERARRVGLLLGTHTGMSSHSSRALLCASTDIIHLATKEDIRKRQSNKQTVMQ
jgi:hypothetical protein